LDLRFKELSEQVIGAAIEVHKALGPGLLESAYEVCLCYELSKRGVPFQRQKPMPVTDKEVKLDCGYRIDVLVDGKIVVEIKSVDNLLPVHEAQLLTYMRLGGFGVGLLINFNEVVLKDGLVRMVL
jgi:GxxExxY protein